MKKLSSNLSVREEEHRTVVARLEEAVMMKDRAVEGGKVEH